MEQRLKKSGHWVWWFKVTHKQYSNDLPADDAQEETPPRARDTIRPNGRSSLVVAPSTSSGGRSWGVLRVLSRFHRTGNSKGRFWKRSSRVADAGEGEMMSFCSSSISRSFQSGDDIPSNGRMVSRNNDEAPDDNGQSSSDPALTTQDCAQFRVTIELATNHREQSPNIAQEGTIIDTPSFSRPTGRVILQTLENGPKGATVNVDDLIGGNIHLFLSCPSPIESMGKAVLVWVLKILLSRITPRIHDRPEQYLTQGRETPTPPKPRINNRVVTYRRTMHKRRHHLGREVPQDPMVALL